MAGPISTANISVGADTSAAYRAVDKATRDFSTKTINLKIDALPLGRISKDIGELNKSLEAANARVLAFGASAGVIAQLSSSFQRLISDTIQVEKSLTDIGVVLNTNSEGLRKFSSELFNVARNSASSFQQAATAATEFSRQGLKVEEILKRTNDALILARLSGTDYAKAVEGLTATINGFAQAALTTTDVVNKLATVDAAFAVSSKDLIEGLSRSAAVAQDARVNFDQLIALITTLQQTTARGGAVIGNSIKSIFTRIQRPEVLDDLEKLGIATRDITGAQLSAIDVLTNLAKTYDKLSESQRSAVAEQTGGVFQINQLKAALRDLGGSYSIYNNALQESLNSTNQAIARNQELNKTLSALAARTQASATEAGAKVGERVVAPAARNVLGLADNFSQTITQAVDAQNIGGSITRVILDAIGNTLAGPGIIAIGAVLTNLVRKLGGDIREGFNQLVGQNSAISQQKALHQEISSLLTRETGLYDRLATGALTVAQAEAQILAQSRESLALLQQRAKIASDLSSRLYASGARVQDVGGGRTTITKAGGHVPYEDAVHETQLALRGGYKAGAVKRIEIPGAGQAIYNDAETVRKFPGINQPAILPPRTSKAGEQYKDRFSAAYGFDPYKASGHVPNFAFGFGFNKLPIKNYPIDIPDEEIEKIYKQYARAYLGFGKGEGTGGKLPVGLNIFGNKLVNKAAYSQTGDSHILGANVGGIFVPSHFAPSGIKEGYQSIKELAKYDNVAALVTDNLTAQLSKAGFSKIKSGLKVPFRGETVEKDLLFSSAIKTPLLAAKLLPQLLAGDYSALKDVGREDGQERNVYFGARGKSNNVANLMKEYGFLANGYIPNFAAGDYGPGNIDLEGINNIQSLYELFQHPEKRSIASNKDLGTILKKVFPNAQGHLSPSSFLSPYTKDFSEFYRDSVLGNIYNKNNLLAARKQLQSDLDSGFSFGKGTRFSFVKGKGYSDVETDQNQVLQSFLRRSAKGLISDTGGIDRLETFAEKRDAIKSVPRFSSFKELAQLFEGGKNQTFGSRALDRATEIYKQNKASIFPGGTSFYDDDIRHNFLYAESAYDFAHRNSAFESFYDLEGAGKYKKNLDAIVGSGVDLGRSETYIDSKDTYKTVSNQDILLGRFRKSLKGLIPNNPDSLIANSRPRRLLQFRKGGIGSLEKEFNLLRSSGSQSGLGIDTSEYGQIINKIFNRPANDDNYYLGQSFRDGGFDNFRQFLNSRIFSFPYGKENTESFRQSLEVARNYDPFQEKGSSLNYDKGTYFQDVNARYRSALKKLVPSSGDPLDRYKRDYAKLKATSDDRRIQREAGKYLQPGAPIFLRKARQNPEVEAGENTVQRTIETIRNFAPPNIAKLILGLGRGFNRGYEDSQFLFRGVGAQELAILNELGETTSLGVANEDKKYGTNLTSSFAKAAGYALTLSRSNNRAGYVLNFGKDILKQGFDKSPFDSERSNTVKVPRITAGDVLSVFDAEEGRFKSLQEASRGLKADPKVLEKVKALLGNANLLNSEVDQNQGGRSLIELIRKFDIGGLKPSNLLYPHVKPNTEKIENFNYDQFVQYISDHTGSTRGGFIPFGTSNSSYFRSSDFRLIGSDLSKKIFKDDSFNELVNKGASSVYLRRQVAGDSIYGADKLRKLIAQDVSPEQRIKNIRALRRGVTLDLADILGDNYGFKTEREYPIFSSQADRKLSVGNLYGYTAAGYVPNFANLKNINYLGGHVNKQQLEYIEGIDQVPQLKKIVKELFGGERIDVGFANLSRKYGKDYRTAGAVYDPNSDQVLFKQNRKDYDPEDFARDLFHEIGHKVDYTREDKIRRSINLAGAQDVATFGPDVGPVIRSRVGEYEPDRYPEEVFADFFSSNVFGDDRFLDPRKQIFVPNRRSATYNYGKHSGLFRFGGGYVPNFNILGDVSFRNRLDAGDLITKGFIGGTQVGSSRVALAPSHGEIKSIHLEDFARGNGLSKDFYQNIIGQIIGGSRRSLVGSLVSQDPTSFSLLSSFPQLGRAKFGSSSSLQFEDFNRTFQIDPRKFEESLARISKSLSGKDFGLSEPYLSTFFGKGHIPNFALGDILGEGTQSRIYDAGSHVFKEDISAQYGPEFELRKTKRGLDLLYAANQRANNSDFYRTEDLNIKRLTNSSGNPEIDNLFAGKKGYFQEKINTDNGKYGAGIHVKRLLDQVTSLRGKSLKYDFEDFHDGNVFGNNDALDIVDLLTSRNSTSKIAPFAKYTPRKRASGYIPNFNIAEGYDRECKALMALGYTPQQISGNVKYAPHSDLPNGGIYNTLQEKSLTDGINFSRKAGIDPLTKGLPNFAADPNPNFPPPRLPLTPPISSNSPAIDLGGAVQDQINGIGKAIAQKIAKLNEAIGTGPVTSVVRDILPKVDNIVTARIEDIAKVNSLGGTRAARIGNPNTSESNIYFNPELQRAISLNTAKVNLPPSFPVQDKIITGGPAKESLLRRVGTGLAGAGLPLIFGAEALGSLASEALGPTNGFSKGIGALSSGASIGATVGQFNPLLGVFAGLGVAAFKAADAFRPATTLLERFSKELDDFKGPASRAIDGSNAFLQSFNALQEAIEKGASPSEISRLSQKQSSDFVNLDGKIQSRIAGVRDPEQIQRLIAEEQQRIQSELRVKQVNQEIAQGNSGFFSGKYESFTSDNAGQKRLADTIEILRTVIEPKDFGNSGVVREQLQSRGFKNSDIEQLVVAFKALSRETGVSKEANDQYTKGLNETSRIQRALVVAQENYNKSLAVVAQNLIQAANLSANVQKNRTDLDNNRIGNDNEFRKAGAEGRLGLARARGLDPLEALAIQRNINANNIRNDSDLNRKKIIDESIDGVTALFSSAIEEATSAATYDVTAKKNEIQDNAAAERGNRVASEAERATKEGATLREAVLQAFRGGGSGVDIAERIRGNVGKLNFESPQIGVLRDKISGNAETFANNLSTQFERANQTEQQLLRQNIQQTELQRQSLELQRNNKIGGGFEGFLDTAKRIPDLAEIARLLKSTVDNRSLLNNRGEINTIGIKDSARLLQSAIQFSGGRSISQESANILAGANEQDIREQGTKFLQTLFGGASIGNVDFRPATNEFQRLQEIRDRNSAQITGNSNLTDTERTRLVNANDALADQQDDISRNLYKRFGGRDLRELSGSDRVNAESIISVIQGIVGSKTASLGQVGEAFTIRGRGGQARDFDNLRNPITIAQETGKTLQQISTRILTSTYAKDLNDKVVKAIETGNRIQSEVNANLSLSRANSDLNKAQSEERSAKESISTREQQRVKVFGASEFGENLRKQLDYSTLPGIGTDTQFNLESALTSPLFNNLQKNRGNNAGLLNVIDDAAKRLSQGDPNLADLRQRVNPAVKDENGFRSALLELISKTVSPDGTVSESDKKTFTSLNAASSDIKSFRDSLTELQRKTVDLTTNFDILKKSLDVATGRRIGSERQEVLSQLGTDEQKKKANEVFDALDKQLQKATDLKSFADQNPNNTDAAKAAREAQANYIRQQQEAGATLRDLGVRNLLPGFNQGSLVIPDNLPTSNYNQSRPVTKANQPQDYRDTETGTVYGPNFKLSPLSQDQGQYYGPDFKGTSSAPTTTGPTTNNTNIGVNGVTSTASININTNLDGAAIQKTIDDTVNAVAKALRIEMETKVREALAANGQRIVLPPVFSNNPAGPVALNSPA